MIKTVGLFDLPPGADADGFWQDHTQVHARELARIGGDLLRGYTISRVRAPLVGEPRFWGMVELWFDDAAARAEFDARTMLASPGDDGAHFEDYVRGFSAVEVDEHVVVTPVR